jgi:hypothetical protein
VQRGIGTDPESALEHIATGALLVELGLGRREHMPVAEQSVVWTAFRNPRKTPRRSQTPLLAIGENAERRQPRWRGSGNINETAA